MSDKNNLKIAAVLIFLLSLAAVVYFYFVQTSQNTNRETGRVTSEQEEPNSDRVSFDCEAPNSCVPRLSCDKENRLELATCNDTQGGDLVCCSQ